MNGIKETKEAIHGIFAVAAVLVEVLKDGVQIEDALALFAKIQGDPVLKQKLDDAIRGIGEVPGELGDLQTAEVIELAVVAIQELPKFLEAFKK